MPVMLLIDLYFFIFNCIVFSLGEKLFYDHIIINIGINIFYSNKYNYIYKMLENFKKKYF